MFLVSEIKLAHIVIITSCCALTEMRQKNKNPYKQQNLSQVKGNNQKFRLAGSQGGEIDIV